MTNGGWHDYERGNGRHRQGAKGAAWTPAVRPTDTTPAHARLDGFGPGAWPNDQGPGWPPSEVLTRRPGWPIEPGDPVGAVGGTWPEEEPSWPEEPAWPTPDDVPGPDSPPARTTVLAHGMARAADREPVVHALSETTATGLRKFDLGNVPASVTPPRSWRRAAWFAVGTSAAVVLGLTVAAIGLMSRPAGNGLIDALPAYPSGPLTLGKLPTQQTAASGTPTAKSRTSKPETTPAPSSEPSSDVSVPINTVLDTTTGDVDTTDFPRPHDSSSQAPSPTTPKEPTRETVGAVPLIPTDPAAMGDRTEQYFLLVVTDPGAAHAMTTGSLADEGREGIEARYEGVRQVEVQDILIDRGQAITTSTVRIVREDGSVTFERRQLVFTWGGDPKIINDLVTG
ncbi:hypothetical protein [Actinophytocola oryzae]|uniref:Uncharacterized protein n=1 Tax=Actinophytocola oryzae TaxID=502181 RepID=A0A4R7UYY4_9PSEU|nr:hypothetical protein [Actinophytocola oryzae]TDV41367.1 hypothetical protein CLV71_12057 [Actinophytocola oryzae]